MIIHESVNELDRRKEILNEGIITKIILKKLHRKIMKSFAILCAYILLYLIGHIVQKTDNKKSFRNFIDKNPEFLSSINKISNNILDIILNPLDKYNSNYFIPKRQIENKDLKLSRDESSNNMILEITIMDFDEKLLFSELSGYDCLEDYAIEDKYDEASEEKIKDVKELFNIIETNINELNIELAQKYKILKVTGNWVYEAGGTNLNLVYGLVLKITFDPDLQYKLDPEMKKEISKQFDIFKPLVKKRLKL